MDAESNPLAASPRGATLTNKPMLTEFDFHRLLMVIPETHSGIQDKLICHLLWAGCTLTDINQLQVADVPRLPEKARTIAERTLPQRTHSGNLSLWVDKLGQPRKLYGQKIKLRLQKYAKLTELKEPERVSTSLLYQSGNYYRLSVEED